MRALGSGGKENHGDRRNGKGRKRLLNATVVSGLAEVLHSVR